jgi:hypothetical protein
MPREVCSGYVIETRQVFQYTTQMASKVVEVAIPSAPAMLVVVAVMKQMH